MKQSIIKLLDELAAIFRSLEPGAADRALDEMKKEETEVKH